MPQSKTRRKPLASSQMAQNRTQSKNTDSSTNNKRSKRNSKEDSTSRIRFRTSFRNVVYDVLKGRGWKESVSAETDPATPNTAPNLNWDVNWADREWMRETFDRMHLEAHQKVNHFRNHYELTRKDMMARNIKKLRRRLQRSGLTDELDKYDFIPMTYTLPHEYGIFVEEFRKNAALNRQCGQAQWIMKPVGKCQGRGIFLFTKLGDIAEWKYNPAKYKLKLLKSKEEEKLKAAKGKEDEDQEKCVESYVVQRYISAPLLIGNKKFDLRIYVLVTSYSPLIVFVYRSGFARFTNSRYSSSKANLDDASMHLTNAAIQKTSNKGEICHDSKWNIRSLKLYLVTKHGEARVNALFKEMNDVIIRSLIAVKDVMIHDKHCFELYGYDIMIDRDLKSWLIEANAAPSFTASSDEDYLLKFSVLNDCLDIVMNQMNQSQNKLSHGGFDLVYRDGHVEYHSRCLITSHLGCHNASMEKYKKIIKRVGKMKKKGATVADNI